MRTLFLAASALLVVAHPAPAVAGQEKLTPVINSGERLLQFDWPMLRIGTGEYEEGRPA
jgi:hypothetical protein